MNNLTQLNISLDVYNDIHIIEFKFKSYFGDFREKVENLKHLFFYKSSMLIKYLYILYKKITHL